MMAGYWPLYSRVLRKIDLRTPSLACSLSDFRETLDLRTPSLAPLLSEICEVLQTPELWKFLEGLAW
jgi:hypothetical protein